MKKFLISLIALSAVLCFITIGQKQLANGDCGNMTGDCDNYDHISDNNNNNNDYHKDGISNETTDTLQSKSDKSISDSGVTDNQGNPDTSNDNLQTDTGQNSQPVADGGPDLEVDEKTNVILDGSGSSDQEGEIISYSWMQTDGSDKVELSSADSIHPSFIAPNVDSNQQLGFQLTVSDAEGLTDTDVVNVLVRNTDPAFDMANSHVQEPGIDLEKPPSLEPSPSTDCTGNETDCTSREILPSQPMPIPPATECTDNQTDCSQNQPIPPTITECVGNETGCTSTEGPPVLCNGNDTNCNRVEQEPPTTGPCEGNSTSCISTGEPLAPDCFDSMVGNMTGNMTGSSCNPSPQRVPKCPDNFGNMTGNMTDCAPLERENMPPVADAGGDQTVDEDSPVTLAGNNSYDRDGNITSYSWIQTEGEPLITIVDANSPSPTFMAPLVDSNSTITLQLTVTDNYNDSSIDYTNIFVTNSNATIIPPPHGTISIDEVPNQIEAGSIFVFSGKLDLQGVANYNKSYIQIRDFNNGTDDILSFNTADKDGRFVTEWTAIPREAPYHVYAVYEDGYSHTLKSGIQMFLVRESKLQLENQTLSVQSGPYIPIVFNDYKKKNLNVYIRYDDESAPYVSTAVNAINHWSAVLQERSGNQNAWKFNIFTSRGFPNSETSVNILVNLERGNDGQCPAWSKGCAHNTWLSRLLNQRLIIHVYTGGVSQQGVFYITSHEFGHALGLGHTWNEGNFREGTADMMCSRDYRSSIFGLIPLGQLTQTCQSPFDTYHDKQQPSEFDVRAVLYAYENDGFQSPNLKLSGNDIYVCQPLPCEPPKGSVEPKIVNPPIVKITNPKSPPIKSPVDDNQEAKKKITTVITTTKEDRNSKPKILSGLGSYRLIAKLGTFGSGPGQFNHPAAISGDENGQRFYVADLDNNRIEVIHRGGNYITEWGTLGTGKGQFNGPGSIAVDNNHKLVFVSDIKNNRIEKFDTQGKYIGQWGKLGTANGQFDHPGDIALDPDKEILYVTDIYNNRIQSFYYDGNFINQWGSFGQQDGQFNRPAGITINQNDSLLYVSDTANNRIQVFDTDGKFVKKWGSLGIGNGQFARPDGIFFEPSEKAVYIADRQNSRIQVFDDHGAFITSWKVSSGIDGVSIKPRDITMDPTGQLYIADKDNSNILVYNISASNALNELTSQSVKSKTDSSSHESSGSNNNKDSNDSTDKGKKHVEPPAQPEKGKIQVTYGDVSGYNGKANIQIKNLDKGQTLVSAKLNFGKQHASQGDHCCVKTYDFDWKGSSVGDRLGIKVTGGGGSWEDNSGYQLKKGTTKASVSLEEIGE